MSGCLRWISYPAIRHVRKCPDPHNANKVREKSRECHNHKPQPFPDPKRKRKPTNLNKHKPYKRTKSTKISSLFPKRDNRNTKRSEKHKNKMTHGKIYNKSPRRINNKATKSKTNTGSTALERSVEQTADIYANWGKNPVGLKIHWSSLLRASVGYFLVPESMDFHSWEPLWGYFLVPESMDFYSWSLCGLRF